jgi:hypothetical protein
MGCGSGIKWASVAGYKEIFLTHSKLGGIIYETLL